MRIFLALTAILALVGCGDRRNDGQVVVSVIGGQLSRSDSSLGEQGLAARLMIGATAQGLVRFDGSGQIEPGIAERWIVIDDGMSYIFRLRDAEWSDGEPVTAAQIVTILRRQLARGSLNPLLPFLSAIDEVVEMTPEVIEVRLKRPRPDLLKLFAQPEMALFRARPPGGSGPLRIVSAHGPSVLLRPIVDPTRSPDDLAALTPEDDVRVIGERAALAIARFANRQSDLVSGGSVVDWPLFAAADIAPINRKIDPAAGLFGLAVTNRGGFLADANGRSAVAAAIDRPAVLGAFLAEWSPMTQLLPEQLDSAAPPAVPDWAGVAPDARLADTQRTVAAWKAAHGGILTLHIALPVGPGATILFATIEASLTRVGIRTVRVGMGEAADLKLIDAVAPYDSARWYLATACAPCGDTAQAALEAARDAPTAALRSQRIAEADAALTADAAYIPIARPLRWSLVSMRLDGWRANTRAWHPLNHLRNDTK